MSNLIPFAVSAAASLWLFFFLFANPAVSFELIEESFEPIASYEPRSQVTDHNVMDLDLLAIREQLAIGTDASFAKARKIYTQGGHSKPAARVTLGSPLEQNLAKRTPVTGPSEDGTTLAVPGFVAKDYPPGTTEIEIRYQTSKVQTPYLGCRVGGLAVPGVGGCLARNGTLALDNNNDNAGGDGAGLEYSYDPDTQNVNLRTYQMFSTTSEAKMYRCGETCPYRTYSKFRDYYGDFLYAEQWIEAAFGGTATTLETGNANFARYGSEGRAEAVRIAIVGMSIWMVVIGALEASLDVCKDDCKKTGCNEAASGIWDKAVAFYTGSLEGTDGNGSGELLYELANEGCRNFKTCGYIGTGESGTAFVNREIFRSFAHGSLMMMKMKCGEARKRKEYIERMMMVPLIQGTLRYAYLASESEVAEAQRAAFAAAILPIVHDCDPEAAEVIYEHTKTNGGLGSFAAVKASFEKVYGCLGIRASEVGGLWNRATGAYFTEAEPIPDAEPETKDKTNARDTARDEDTVISSGRMTIRSPSSIYGTTALAMVLGVWLSFF